MLRKIETRLRWEPVKIEEWKDDMEEHEEKNR